jgi:hypothetical protein
MRSLVRLLPNQPLSAAITTLQGHGVPILSSGRVDLNADGDPEQWATIRHPGSSEVELWILSSTPTGPTAGYAGLVSSPRPSIRTISQDIYSSLASVDDNSAFRLTRHPVTDEPFITRVLLSEARSPSDEVAGEFDRARDQLLKGSDPEPILETLLALDTTNELDCDSEYVYHPHARCPDMLYLLGLAAELSGDDAQAVREYLRLWRDYPESPYSVIAALKLAETTP